MLSHCGGSYSYFCDEDQRQTIREHFRQLADEKARLEAEAKDK